jgi:hypothetical protein
MRVFQIEGGWGHEHLRLSTRPDPAPGPGDVMLRMKAASLNFRDLVVPDRGYGRYTGELPLIPVIDAMEKKGVLIDAAYLVRLNKTYAAEVLETQKKVI